MRGRTGRDGLWRDAKETNPHLGFGVQAWTTILPQRQSFMEEAFEW